MRRAVKSFKSTPATGVSSDSFSDRCYALLRTVPAGRVTTYKALANALGTAAYRAVGTAMNKNPYAPTVPCHRVINADGKLGGFAHGLDRKKELLRAEGVVISDERIDLDRFGFSFD